MLRISRGIGYAWHARRQIASSSAADVPVAIVGAGPTGLTLSWWLSRYGVEHVVLERSSELTNHPQAHVINQRTMEIFRPMDGLVDRIQSQVPPLDEWRKFIYCETMVGRAYGEVDHFAGQHNAYQRHLSPEPVAHLSQHKLLPMLLDVAQRYGTARVLFGHRVDSVQQLADSGVQLSVSTPGRSSQHLRCQYLVAADGAHSAIRQQLGISMVGEPAIQHLINVHFVSEQLAQLLRKRPAMLHFVFSSQAIVVMVSHSLERGEFVAQIPYFPPLQSQQDFAPDVCSKVIAAAAGVPQLDLRVRTIKAWTMNAQVADRYQVGRVFLAGDAVHRLPPSGGFGMNTGVQDAHNLAWKLAAALALQRHGAAPPARPVGSPGSGAPAACTPAEASQRLLASYHLERRPVAEANTALSVANWNEAVRVPSALGLDPRAATLVNQLVSSSPLPPSWSKVLLESSLSLGMSLSGTSGPLAPWRQAQLDEIFASGLTLRLQFPKEDLGFRYAKGAICTDDPAATPFPSSSKRDDPFVPSAAPGCRLPHFEVQLLGSPKPSSGAGGGSSCRDAGSCSVLDVVSDCAATSLLLVLGPEAAGSGSALQAAARQVQQQLASGPLQLNVLQLLPAGSSASSSPSSSWEAAAGWWRPAVDLDGKWEQVAGVGPAGVLLVRPDGHVAWRRATCSSASADAGSLAAALLGAVAAVMNVS